MRPTILPLTLIAALLLTSLAHAAAVPLREQHGAAPYSVYADSQYSVEKLGSTGEPAMTFAAALPPDARDFAVVGLRAEGFYVRLAAGSAQGTSGTVRPLLALQVGAGEAQLVKLDAAVATGPLAQVQVWSVAPAAQNGAVLLASFSSATGDVPILGLHVAPDGAITSVDLGGARSINGAFDVSDLDADGDYELITQRNLDGWAGGFTYRAVRAYDAATQSYKPDPASYREFFDGELKFLQWVLTTRQLIVDDPAPYMSREPRGWYFVAEYQGTPYGFDSLIPLDKVENAGGDIGAYNLRVENAFRHVQEYHDQLAAWVSGGPQPSAWQMKR
jgi:hypothetical protein